MRDAISPARWIWICIAGGKRNKIKGQPVCLISRLNLVILKQLYYYILWYGSFFGHVCDQNKEIWTWYQCICDQSWVYRLVSFCWKLYLGFMFIFIFIFISIKTQFKNNITKMEEVQLKARMPEICCTTWTRNTLKPTLPSHTLEQHNLHTPPLIHTQDKNT